MSAPRWIIGGRIGTIVGEPGWRAFLGAHDDQGKPIEAADGQVPIIAADVASWAVFLMIAAPAPGESPAAVKPSATMMRPLDALGRELDAAKGYLGLSYPGETDEAAVARLIGAIVEAPVGPAPLPH